MLHVAVLLRPYLDLVLSGRKTVECRLTKMARPPYGRIESGERIYFKESAGPFRATAIAEHVLCEDNLTPRRVRQIKRDYNDLILGEDDFWNRKLDSSYCTLIWLREVEPCQKGPSIGPLQGAAWALVAEPGRSSREIEAAPIRGRVSGTAGEVFSIVITGGNLKNNTLYATKVADRFPAWCFGGATKHQAARPVTLMLAGGPTLRSDLVGKRRMFRTRAWGRWFRDLEARAGDRVVFTPADEQTYFVGLARS